MNFLKQLKLARFKFVIEATQPLWLPAYKGATFRGAFGNTFRRIVCVQEKQPCEQCVLNANCAYYYIFETPNPMTLPAFDSPKVPHPFVLEPPLERREHFPVGAELTFYLILVGNAIDYLPYFIYTFDEMGRRGGIGKGRRQGQGRFALKQVLDGTDETRSVYDGETKILNSNFSLITSEAFEANTESAIQSLRLDFLTPVRIKHLKRYLLKDGKGTLDFQLLIENLYRRLFYLVGFFCSDFDDSFCLPRVSGVNLTQNRLRWQDWERYSSRQQARIKLGGFVGTVAFEGDIQPWLPLIRAGELLHLGKATAFGLGKYVIQD